MYIQQDHQPVYKLRYFTPDDNSSGKQSLLNHAQNDESVKKPNTMDDKDENIRRVKSFLEPGDEAFANIRKRLSTLSLKSDYNKGLDPFYFPPPIFRDRERERRLPPRRISSISSRDTTERHQEKSVKPSSKTSFRSDDNEFRRVKQAQGTRKQRASESGAAIKLTENVLKARQNPELFSRQIQLNEKGDRTISSRSTSPKSVRSVDSSGKMHLGLIESLDLNEKLKDVERIKERYSNDAFMNSLVLYKMRGHDRCFYPDTNHSYHVPRGTKLNPDSRSESKLSIESENSKLTPTGAPHNYYIGTNSWAPDKSHVYNQFHAKPIVRVHEEDRASKRKKCVEFNMTPREFDTEAQEPSNPPPSRGTLSGKRPKSILKRNHSETHSDSRKSPNIREIDGDEFLANASYRWRFQLPKVNSPNASLRPRPPVTFRKKMYHFGDGVSKEFEQVIARYGNCRQNSLVKDLALAREASYSTSHT